MAAALRPDGGPATEAGEGSTCIRVMIVDDSAIARQVLARMIGHHGDMEVVATAGSAAEALAALRSVRPHVILLDVEMPGTSGLDALPDILAASGGAKVLIVSSTADEGAANAVRALALGAADTLPKPGTSAFRGRFSEVLAAKLRALAPIEALARPAAPRPDSGRAAICLRAMPAARIECLALGASTGGLHALSEFLRALGGEIGAPILITQHLPPVFMPIFARQIEAASGRPTRVAEDGMKLQPDRILIAPGDAHMEVERAGGEAKVKLTRGPVSSGCKPSLDPMFWSLGESFGAGALGLVFSGMGRDGLVGGARLVHAGGALLAQDEASSAIWGMPRAVAEAGLVSAVLSPAGLAARVAARVESMRP